MVIENVLKVGSYLILINDMSDSNSTTSFMIKGCGSKSVYYQRIGNYLKVYKFVSAPFIKHIAVPSSKLEFPFFLSLVLSCLVSPQDGL